MGVAVQTDNPARALFKQPPQFPGRRTLQVQGMRVLLDPEDADLAEWDWRFSTRTTLRRRVHTVDPETKRDIYRWVVLHRQIAKRAFGLAEEPRRVRFRNGALLDCRRRNLLPLD